MNFSKIQIVLMAALINTSVELEISAPSFPDMVKIFQTTQDAMNLTLSWNFLGVCLAALFYGPFSESLGRRRAILLGQGLLVVGAVGCLFSRTVQELWLWRFIQGLGAAGAPVVVNVIIADLYDEKEASRLYSLMNFILTSFMALAPLLGGWIHKWTGWKGNYAFVALTCIIAFWSSWKLLPETKKSPKISFWKVATQYRGLLEKKEFWSFAAVPSLLYGSYMAFVGIAPFLYKEVFFQDISIYTLHMALLVAAFSMVSAFYPKITHHFGEKISMKIGLLSIISGGAFLFFSHNSQLMIGSMIVIGMGEALVVAPLSARAMVIYPHLKGVAASMIMSLRYMLCSFVTALAGWIYNGTYSSVAWGIFPILVFSSYLVMSTGILKKS